MAELSIKNFPEDLKRKLKVAAAMEGITLGEYVIKYLEDLVTPPKRKK
jgi:plasmid stability protein